MNAPLLQVEDLVKHYRLPRERLLAPAPLVRALEGVSFDLDAGRSLGVVGESGSGKSTLARLVMALAAIAWLNWAALNAVTAVSLGVTQGQAPLGLVVLAFAAALGVLLIVRLVVQQAGAAAEGRLHAKELAAQRDLADRAEAARFSELRAHLDTELRRLEAQAAEQRGSLLTRIDGLQGTLQDEATRSLSAYIGEVDDKLDRLQRPG